MCFLKEMVEVLECTVAQAVEKMNPEERDELKVSGKNADLKKKKIWLDERASYAVFSRKFTCIFFLFCNGKVNCHQCSLSCLHQLAEKDLCMFQVLKLLIIFLL